MSQLEEIKARVEGHTEGPWRTWQHGGGPRNSGVETTWAHKGDEPVQISDWCFPADAELIAAAPKLLAALEEAERELRALDQVFGKDDDVIHAVITQVRQAITEALA